MTRWIKLIEPDLGESEIEAVAKVLKSGALTQGPCIAEFEAEIAKYVGCKFAVATTSATSALHLSLCVLDIKAGDEVLIPDFTFPATINVIIQTGATPVLVDIDPLTYCMSTSDLVKKISRKSKAVMPVHCFGHPASMEEILRITTANGLLIIEDAACAIGSEYKNRRCGSFGTLSCFSFHPRKILTTGEGGMVCTDDPKIYERLKQLRSHGARIEGSKFIFDEPGYNYRMTEMQAAIGVVQLKKLEAKIQTRRHIAEKYSVKFKDTEITAPSDLPDTKHTYQSYVVLLPERAQRDTIVNVLRKKGIESTVGTYSLHLQPAYQKYCNSYSNDLVVSKDIYKRSLTLPLHSSVSPFIEDISNALIELANTNF